jgi:hypothetical protein
MRRFRFISSICLALLVLAGCGEPDESEANRAPEALLTVNPSGEVGLGTQVGLSAASSTDPDGDILEFRWDVTAPDGTDVLDGARGVSQTFTPQQTGDFEVSLSVSDGQSSSSASVTVVAVEGGNRPPTADAGPDRDSEVDEPIRFNGRDSSDPDGDQLTYAWRLLSRPEGSEVQLTDTDQARARLRPDVVGTYEAELTVTDPAGESDTDTAIANVTIGNRPPTADAGDDADVAVAAEATLDASGSSDPDGDDLTFTWSIVSQPSGSSATLDGTDGQTTTFTPDVEGEYTMSVTVDDGEFTDSDEVVLTATVENLPPVADAGPDQNAGVGSTVTLDGSGSTDPNGDALTFAWAFTNDPSGGADTITDASMETATFSPSVTGTYTVELTVTDPGGLSDTDTVDVVVTDGNQPPVADAGPDQSVAVSDSVTLDGSGSSDPDGDTLTFAWAFTNDPSGGADTITDANMETASFSPTVAGTYTVELTVTDPGGLSDSDTVDIVVGSGNTPPTANAGSDQTVAVGTQVTVDASASSDAEDALMDLTFAWAFTSDPDGSTTFADAAAQSTTFTPNTAGDYVIELTVTDTGGLSDTATITVTATAADQPPVASFTAPTATHRGTSAALDASGSSDPDGDTLMFAWSLTADPSGADSVANTTAEQTTLTPSATGAYEITLDVTANSASDSASRTMYSVEPTGAPCLIVSEYIEASSNNKGFEIYNCGTSSIDLTSYRVCLSSNTTTDCSSGDLDLTGTLAAGAVQTVCNSSIDTAVYSGTCDYSGTVATFNGNDRLLIYEDVDASMGFNAGDTRVDAFGVTGTEPGAGAWQDTRWQRCNYTTWSGAAGEGLDNTTFSAVYETDAPATDADYFTNFGAAPSGTCGP